MCIGRFLAGFIIGGAVGGIAGILLAPDSGEDTREKLIDKSEEAYKYSEESLKEIQSKANDVIENIQNKGDELYGKVQDLINKHRSEEA